MSVHFKVMTFNLRLNTHHDGENAFPYRTKRIREVILKESPDLIGFQELTDGMKADMRKLLPEYTIVGCGRNATFDGESMAIAMKNGVVDLLSLEQFWLSPTPTIPGSRYMEDQSLCPRMALSAKLVIVGCPTPIRLCNTHLDHVGKQARYQGMMQIVQHLSAQNEPFILTGDMNATPDANEIGLVSQVLGYRGGKDCTENVGGTFHGYGTLAAPHKIDYIFSDLPCTASYRIDETDTNGFYSDHYAVAAELVC